MVGVTPYLSVSSALEAMELYDNIFGITIIDRQPAGKEQAEVFGIPGSVDLETTTMHAEFILEGTTVYISDNFSGKVLDHTNISLLVAPDTLKAAENIFNAAIQYSCRITQEFKKQFWGDYFGSFTDPFGIAWQINFTEGD